MNLDQETFLTAYLDDELPSDARERVASALATDPRLAEELRALGAVRALVAGLPRSTPTIDISAAVLLEIGKQPTGWVRSGILARLPVASPAWRIVGLAASAAGVVALLTLGFGRPAPRLVRPSIVHHLPKSPPPNEPNTPPRVVVAAPTLPDGDLRPSPEERRHHEEARKVHRMLDDPSLQKVFVVADVLSGDADRRVGAILESSPRKHAEFGRITIAQGIVVDPEHPGQATVYAVVMDDRELGELRVKLADAFPANVQEGTTRPDVVTRLAEIGQVALLPGKPVSDLLEDRVNERQRARRERETPPVMKSDVGLLAAGNDSDPLRDPNRITVVTTDEANDDAPPSPERMASGPHPIVMRERAEAAKRSQSPPASPVPTSTPRESAKPARPRSQVVLVWVPSPAGGRGR